MIRFYSGNTFNLRGRTRIACPPDGFFLPIIDKKKTESLWEEAGKKEEVKAKVATPEEARKKGYVLCDRWDFVEDKFRVNTPDVIAYKETKKKVEELKAAILAAHMMATPSDLQQSEEDRKAGKPNWLQSVIDDFHSLTAEEVEEEPLTMEELGRMYLEAKDIAEARKRHFRGLFRIIKRFELYRRTEKGGEDFRFLPNEITEDDVADLYDYIANEAQLQREEPKKFEKILKAVPLEDSKKHRGQTIHERGENRQAALQKLFRMVFTWGTTKKSEGSYIVTNTLDFGRIENRKKEKYDDVFLLEEEELFKIADFDLSGNEALATQRDIFVFQCLVPLRVSDMYALTSENVVSKDGKHYSINYIPQKTIKNDTKVREIPINYCFDDRIINLLRKYEGVDKKGRLFPFISKTNYNDRIKEVLEVCGIDRPVVCHGETMPICKAASSHMARRTGTKMYISVYGYQMAEKLTGHSKNSPTMKRYYEYNENDAWKALGERLFD